MDKVINEIAALAMRWRNESPSSAEFSAIQRSEDGYEILDLLDRHGVQYSRDYASITILAPGRPSSQAQADLDDVVSKVKEVGGVVRYEVHPGAS